MRCNKTRDELRLNASFVRKKNSRETTRYAGETESRVDLIEVVFDFLRDEVGQGIPMCGRIKAPPIAE